MSKEQSAHMAKELLKELGDVSASHNSSYNDAPSMSYRCEYNDHGFRIRASFDCNYSYTDSQAKSKIDADMITIHYNSYMVLSQDENSYSPGRWEELLEYLYDNRSELAKKKSERKQLEHDTVNNILWLCSNRYQDQVVATLGITLSYTLGEQGDIETYDHRSFRMCKVFLCDNLVLEFKSYGSSYDERHGRRFHDYIIIVLNPGDWMNKLNTFCSNAKKLEEQASAERKLQEEKKRIELINQVTFPDI